MLIWNKELPHHWKNKMFHPITKRAIELTLAVIEVHRCCQLRKKIFSNILLCKLTPSVDEITGDTTDT
jgi:hypothetical protein